MSAGYIHRFCALLTFTYFGLHLYDLAKQRRQSGKTWWQFIAGPESMLFNRGDWHELVASLKWFFGRGPQPKYGRWTYWEKFDYFAVFWGVAVIGGTGLLLWFPELFTRVLPGWVVNVATTIHSDEALLAVSFIFVVHFFNTHFRPEKFPIDTVIFTEGMPLEEFRRDRPREYRQLLESGPLHQTLAAPGLHGSRHRPADDRVDRLRHGFCLPVKQILTSDIGRTIWAGGWSCPPSWLFWYTWLPW